MEGRPFELTSLAAVSGGSDTEVLSALDTVVEAGLVEGGPGPALAVPSRAAPPRRHRVDVPVVSGERTSPVGTGARGRAGDLGDMVSAADHWEALGPSPEAFDARVRAARAAEKAASSVETFGQWRRALTLLQEDPTVGSVERVPGSPVRVVSSRGDWRELATLIRADEACGAPITPLVGLWRRLGRALAARIVVDPSVPGLGARELATIGRDLARSPATPLAFVTADWLAHIHEIDHRWDQQDSAVQLMVDVCAALEGDYPDFELRLLDWRHTQATRSLPIQVAPALGVMNEMLSLEGRLGEDSANRSHIHSLAAWTMSVSGDLDGGIRHARTAVELAVAPEASGAAFYYAALQLLDLSWEVGEWDQALHLAGRLQVGSDWLHFHNMGAATSAMIQLLRGRVDEARAASAGRIPASEGDVAGSRTRYLPEFLARRPGGGTDRFGRDEHLVQSPSRTADVQHQDHAHLVRCLVVAAGYSAGTRPTDPSSSPTRRPSARGHLPGADARSTKPSALAVRATPQRARGNDDPGLGWTTVASEAAERTGVPTRRRGRVASA